ncbi:glycan-binding surface protein [Aridibaculum aurantiacum]|uniref:glycan-binding surface protein n=1 Tax=Aridibaculum aurantiacum TaxID=2810307 RepID=UPI001A956AAF|nr:glycan-binding surface protein [Aridibaculum aurantiacum]
MKKIQQTILMLIMAVAVIGTYTSCKKEQLPNGGEPRIKYVRVTNPASADSLLVGAGQGSLIAIVGENLQDAVEIWFNDQRATLNPTYITSTTILVNVPQPIPTSINNKMKIIFSNGKQLLHDFEVQISKPVVSSMVSEYVNEGDIAVIHGNYFYEPLSVHFTGGVTGTLVSVTDRIIEVRVPAGAQPGQITVKTNFGETKSDFWFRDNRNMVITSDPYEGWWNSSYVVSNPGPNDPPKINGNYIRVKKMLGAWSWNEIAGGPASAMPNHSKNIPDAAIIKPEDYNLKFEINTMKPYNNSWIRINVGLQQEDNNNYLWKPPYDSKGKWNTVIIPFEDIVASYAVRPTVNPNGYWTRLLIQGPGDLDADISFDNFRVVPKVIR